MFYEFNKSLARNCPSKVNSKNYLNYQISVNQFIEKVTSLKNILSSIKSEVSINAYWTHGRSLYFAVCCPGILPYVHPAYKVTQNINLEHFDRIIERCKTLLSEEFPKEKDPLLQSIENLKTTYLEFLTIYL